MKRIAFLVSLTVIFFAHSVKVSAQRFRAGVLGALVVTDVYLDDPRDNDNDFHKLGYMMGAFVNTSLGEKSTIEMELNVIQKGTLQQPDSNNLGYYRLALNYIEIPIVYKHKFSFTSASKPITGFDILAGASFGTLFHAVLEQDYAVPYTGTDYLNTTDVSLLIGTAYNFSNHLNLSLRYSNSIIPAFKRNTPPPGYFFETLNNGTNMVFHFILQYTI